MDIGESKKVVDAMVETLSIGGLYKQNNELFEFCIMGHVGTSHEMGTMACTWPTP